MEILKLITIVITVTSVVGLVAIGIFIGKTFGTFEKFVLEMLEILKEKGGTKMSSCDVRRCNESDAIVMFKNMVGKKPDIVEWYGNRVYVRYSKPIDKRVSFTLYEHEASFEFYTGVDNIRFDGIIKDPRCLDILNEHVAQGKPLNIKDYL